MKEKFNELWNILKNKNYSDSTILKINNIILSNEITNKNLDEIIKTIIKNTNELYIIKELNKVL